LVLITEPAVRKCGKTRPNLSIGDAENFIHIYEKTGKAGFQNRAQIKGQGKEKGIVSCYYSIMIR